jgi:hypothetical protein
MSVQPSSILLYTAYSKEDLKKLSLPTLNKIHEGYDTKTIDKLCTLFGSSALSYEPDLINPYKYYSPHDLKRSAIYRRIPLNDKITYHELIQIMLEDDKNTNNKFKNEIIQKQLFQLTNFDELMFVAAIYKHSITYYNFDFDLLSFKQFIFLFVVMPKLGVINYKYNDYIDKIPIKIKRFALRFYFPVGINVNLLNDNEIENTYKTSVIPKNYKEYNLRAQRLEVMERIPEIIKDIYMGEIKNKWSERNERNERNELSDEEYIRNTEQNGGSDDKLLKFEQLLANSNGDLEQLGIKMGMKYPEGCDTKVEYFLGNFMKYTEGKQRKDM